MRHEPTVVTCVDREALDTLRREPGRLLRQIVPDIVVFDESFVDHAVPFAAFTARRSMFAVWNRPGKGTFHSTTFQPNTISTRHFMNCLAQADPDFFDRHAGDLRGLLEDLTRRGDAFRRHYNPSLLSAHPGRRVRDDRRSRLGLVRRGQRAAGLRCRGRGRLQHSRA